jgi:hypothetical protein
MVEHIFIKIERQLPFEYPMQKFGSNKEKETFIDYGFHLYKEAYFIIDNIEIFESPKHIEDKI